jgi:DNA-binding MarR family transcriptional regulator
MSPRGRKRDSFDDVPLSALLRAGLRSYSRAIERAQARAGLGDLPASGSFLIGAMHWSGASLEGVLRWMGVSKQSVSQSVDALVRRGYLERDRDPSDRRRVRLVLTDRGRAAGAVARTAIEQVDRRLRSEVGPPAIAATRATLAALVRFDMDARRAGRRD